MATSCSFPRIPFARPLNLLLPASAFIISIYISPLIQVSSASTVTPPNSTLSTVLGLAVGTTSLDDIILQPLHQPMPASSAGNLSFLIFQTSLSITVPCTTQLIWPPRNHEPPVRTIVAAPTVAGTYPVILFKHGFNLANCYYTQLFQYLASSGYIIVAPQAVTLSYNCTDEINETAQVANWIPNSLAVLLNAAIADTDVVPDMLKLIMAGHSRGGKIAFAMVLGKAVAMGMELPSFSALVALDPVDGTGPDSEFPPQMVEAGCNHTANNLSIPVLILGTGYGSESAGLFGLMPPCAPQCCNHVAYFNCSSSPLMYHLSALEYGHLDFLDDSQLWTPLMCVSGTLKAPLRNFSGRLMVAFLRATLEGNEEDMDDILENWEEVDSVKLDEPQIYTADSIVDEAALLKTVSAPGHIRSPKHVTF